MSWHNEYIRIPFVDKGRERAGADCWGLARIIYKDRLGVDLPMFNDHESIKDRKAINAIIKQEMALWQPVPAGEEKEYDIVVFNIVGQPLHIGVVVRSGYMVHCQRGAGTTFEDYRGHRWKNRLEGFCRYANSTDNTSTL